MGPNPAVYLKEKNFTPHPDPLSWRGEGIIKKTFSDGDTPLSYSNTPPDSDKLQDNDNHPVNDHFRDSDKPQVLDKATQEFDRVDQSVIPEMLRTIRLTLEYDGSGYHGWQRQLNALTIQEVVETCLGRLSGREVRLHGSGRTDAGVHALGQVAHFRTETNLPLAAFREGLNSLLPRDIVILEAEEAPDGFHARYGAKAKTYEYRILNRQVRSPLHLRHCWHLKQALDLDRMRRATGFIEGKHDFTGFQASGSEVKTAIRRVMAASWEERPGGWKYFRITANGFLRGMVRALVGTLVEVGWGKRRPDDMAKLLAAKDRRLAGPAAPAGGLYLVEVIY
jgi:tRNA pseudouridine38-40 synthase